MKNLKVKVTKKVELLEKFLEHLDDSGYFEHYPIPYTEIEIFFKYENNKKEKKK